MPFSRSRSSWDRFEKWVKENLADPDQYDRIDWATEIGSDLTYSEAIEMALYRFPTLWKDDIIDEQTKRIKQIVFIKPLIGKIRNGEIQVTYRKGPKFGIYYVVNNRFKPRTDDCPIIEFHKTEKVNPYNLSDDEARLAGVDTAKEIVDLFERWYGKPAPELFRNWFSVREDAN